MALVPTVVHALAGLYPWEIEYDDALADSLDFVGSRFEPETVVRAGYGAGIAVLVASSLLLLVPMPPFVGLLLMISLSIGGIYAVHSAPFLLAALRRTEALGETPNLVGRIVLRMEIQPSAESAVRFAAETGRGPLARSLADHIDRSIGTPKTGLLAFADEWSDEFPALERSASLLATAQDAPEAERTQTLDRALAAILDGTRDQMAEFTNAIRGPTTGLYAFGVMLPLALVALVPALGMADVPVSVWLFVVVYNLVLPTLLVVASGWLLVRRPVAFPPPDVTIAHPDVPDRLWRRASLGAVAGIVAYAVTVVLGPAYLASVTGFGLGAGVALLATFHPIMEVRNHVRDVENHLVDALYLVGRQVTEGEAVESAIELAGERVPGATGEVFSKAAGLQRRLHTGVEEAFLGEYGSLRDVPSSRAVGTASLLAIASTEGRPAGRAIVSMADHLEELQRVEAETKRQLSTVTGTLDTTATYFGPMVAGATVGLADMLASHGDTGTSYEMATIPTADLSVVVGVYVITLCFILVPLSCALRYGLDRAVVGYHVGRALVIAVPIYAFSIVIVSQFG